MFEKFKKAKKPEIHIAAERTNLPLDDYMTRLFAQEIPFLDSTSRSEVYRLLQEYDGPTITSQEEIPQEIRELMDL
ncbi:hypothetical protein [Corynebacterium crudilactis]|uniref:Uncharacterized protein n=1 Tax=Corynebacterium crudilactis TaxID=1652495 RepID=A0A172QQK2_9CORY|nr:hypothetical protein [Corynebacterium crudilactis]ANE02940.1 hypothetical protein ccrud_01020 [Corynebacterium crudilactis]